MYDTKLHLMVGYSSEYLGQLKRGVVVTIVVQSMGEIDLLKICSVYMMLTDGSISLSKTVETSRFMFKLTNIGWLIKKYSFCNNNQTLSL